jgi:glucose/arabinose dehydrogenase
VAAAAVVLASLSPLMAQPAFNQYSSNLFWQSGGFDCRVLMVGPQGRIWVGVADGSIRILEDNNQDGVADNIKIFTGGVFSPHGLTWKANGVGWDIFVAHLTAPFGGTGQITRFVDANGDDVVDNSNTIVLAMPTGSHQVNNLKVGPTGTWLYFGQGAVSDTNPGSGALIGRVSPTSQNLIWGDPQIQVFATGLRNPWGLEFHPGGELFCTDTGRDDLGPTEPPDEFNHVVQGGDYGFPSVSGTPPPGSLTTGPVIDLPEHICPVGFAFDTGNAMTGFQNQVFLASWGGWGPTPVGKIKQAQLHQDSTGAWRMHCWDFLANCGKPLDTCVGPGGELYFCRRRPSSGPLGSTASCPPTVSP